MANNIVKLSHNGKDYYMEWSSVTDSPMTDGMSLEEFEEYYVNEYGKNSLANFKDRMRRVSVKGTSSLTLSIEDLINSNRAGPSETTLTLLQLVETYCKGS